MIEQENVLLGIGVLGLEELERIKATLVDLISLGDQAQGTVDRVTAGMRGISQSTPSQNVVRAMAVARSKPSSESGAGGAAKVDPESVNSAKVVGDLRSIEVAANKTAEALERVNKEYDETLARGQRVTSYYEELQDAYRKKLDPAEIERRKEAYYSSIGREFPSQKAIKKEVVVLDEAKKAAAPAVPSHEKATVPSQADKREAALPPGRVPAGHVAGSSIEFNEMLKQLQSINKSTARISTLHKNVESINRTLSEIAGYLRSLPSSKQAAVAAERARQSALPVPTGQQKTSVVSREYINQERMRVAAQAQIMQEQNVPAGEARRVRMKISPVAQISGDLYHSFSSEPSSRNPSSPISTLSRLNRVSSSGYVNADILGLVKSLLVSDQGFAARVVKDLFSDLPRRVLTTGRPDSGAGFKVGPGEKDVVSVDDIAEHLTGAFLDVGQGGATRSQRVSGILGSTAGASPQQRMSKMAMFFDHINQRLRELDASWESGYDVTIPEKPILKVSDGWDRVPEDIQKAFDARLTQHPGVAQSTGMNKMTTQDYQDWFARLYFSPEGGKTVGDFMEGKTTQPFSVFLGRIRKFKHATLKHEAEVKAAEDQVSSLASQKNLERLNYTVRPQGLGGAIVYDKKSLGSAAMIRKELPEDESGEIVEDITSANTARTSRDMIGLVERAADIRSLLENPELLRATHRMVTSAAIKSLGSDSGVQGAADILKQAAQFGIPGLPENVMYSLLNTGLLRSPKDVFHVSRSAGVGKDFEKTVFGAIRGQADRLTSWSPDADEVLEYHDYYMEQGDLRKAQALLSRLSKVDGEKLGSRQQILDDLMAAKKTPTRIPRGPSAKKLGLLAIASARGGLDPYERIEAYLKKGGSDDFARVLQETGFYDAPSELAEHLEDIQPTHRNSMRVRKAGLSYFMDAFKNNPKAFAVDEFATLFHGLPVKDVKGALDELFPKEKGGSFSSIVKNLRRENLFSAIKSSGGLKELMGDEFGAEKLRQMMEDASTKSPVVFDSYGRISEETRRKHPKLWARWEKENPIVPEKSSFNWGTAESVNLSKYGADVPARLVKQVERFLKRLGLTEEQLDKITLNYDKETGALGSLTFKGEAITAATSKRILPKHIRDRVSRATGRELEDLRLDIGRDFIAPSEETTKGEKVGAVKLQNLNEMLSVSGAPLTTRSSKDIREEIARLEKQRDAIRGPVDLSEYSAPISVPAEPQRHEAMTPEREAELRSFAAIPADQLGVIEQDLQRSAKKAIDQLERQRLSAASATQADPEKAEKARRAAEVAERKAIEAAKSNAVRSANMRGEAAKVTDRIEYLRMLLEQKERLEQSLGSIGEIRNIFGRDLAYGYSLVPHSDLNEEHGTKGIVGIGRYRGQSAQTGFGTVDYYFGKHLLGGEGGYGKKLWSTIGDALKKAPANPLTPVRDKSVEGFFRQRLVDEGGKKVVRWVQDQSAKRVGTAFKGDEKKKKSIESYFRDVDVFLSQRETGGWDLIDSVTGARIGAGGDTEQDAVRSAQEVIQRVSNKKGITNRGQAHGQMVRKRVESTGVVSPRYKMVRKLNKGDQIGEFEQAIEALAGIGRNYENYSGKAKSMLLSAGLSEDDVEAMLTPPARRGEKVNRPLDDKAKKALSEAVEQYEAVYLKHGANSTEARDELKKLKSTYIKFGAPAGEIEKLFGYREVSGAQPAGVVVAEAPGTPPPPAEVVVPPAEVAAPPSKPAGSRKKSKVAATQQLATEAEKQAVVTEAESKEAVVAGKKIALSAKKITAALGKIAEVLGVDVKEITFSEMGLRRAGVPKSAIADLQAGGIEAYFKRRGQKNLILNNAYSKDVLRDANAHGLGHAAMDVLGLGVDDPIVKAMKLSANNPELNKTMAAEAEKILGLKFTSGMPSRSDIMGFVKRGDISGLKTTLAPFIKGGRRESILSQMSFDESLSTYFGDNSELSAELFRGLLTDPTSTLSAAPKSTSILLNTLKRSRSQQGKALYGLMSDYLGADTLSAALSGEPIEKAPEKGNGKGRGKKAAKKVSSEAEKAAEVAANEVAVAAENAAEETSQQIQTETKKKRGGRKVGGQKAQAAAQAAAAGASGAAGAGSAAAGGSGGSGGAGGIGGGGLVAAQAAASSAGRARPIAPGSGGVRKPWEITQEERISSPYYEAAGNRSTGWLGATARVALYGSAMGAVYGGFSMFTRQIQEAKDLEQAMVDLKKVMEPDSDFKSIFDAYWESAVKFGRAIGEVAEIGKVFAQQGLEQKQIIDLTKIALIGMNSAELSSAESVEFLTSVFNTWNIKAEDSIHYLDKIMAVQAKFAVTAKELSESSMVLSPIQMVLGGSFDEMLGDITAIKQSTRQPASRITTGLKTIYGRYSEPTYAKQLEKRWGIVTRTDQGIVSPTELFSDISEKYKSGKISEEDLFDISKVLGGVRHFHYIVSLIKNYDTAVDATRISEKANMDAQKAAELQMQTTAYQWMAATNAIKEFGVAISNLTVLPVLKNIAAAVKTIGGGLSSVTRQGTWWSDAISTGIGVAGAGIVGKKLVNLGTKTALTKQLNWVDKTMVSGTFTEAQLGEYLDRTGLSGLGISARSLFSADAAKSAKYNTKGLVFNKDGTDRLKMTMPGLGWFQMYGPMAMAKGAGLSGAAERNYYKLMKESFLSMFDMLNYEPFDKSDGSAVASRKSKMVEYQDYGIRQAARLSPKERYKLARRMGRTFGGDAEAGAMAMLFPTMVGGAFKAGDSGAAIGGANRGPQSIGRFASLLQALPGTIKGVGSALAGLVLPMALTAGITAAIVGLKKLWDYLHRNNIEFKKTIDFTSQNSKDMGTFLAKLTKSPEGTDPATLWATNKEKIFKIMADVQDGGIKSYQDLASRLNEISGKKGLFDTASAKESWMTMRRFMESEVFVQYSQMLDKMRKDATEKLMPGIQQGIAMHMSMIGRVKTAGFGYSYGSAGGDAPVYTTDGVSFSGVPQDMLKYYYGKDWSGRVSTLKLPGESSQLDVLLRKFEDLNKRYAPGSEFLKGVSPEEQVSRFSKEELGEPILLAMRDYFTSGLGNNIEAAQAIDSVIGAGGTSKGKSPADLLREEMQKAASISIEMLAKKTFGDNLEKLSPETKKAFLGSTKELADGAVRATAGMKSFSETLALFKGQFHGKLVDWIASLGKAIARNEEYASVGEQYSLRQEAGRIGKEGMLLKRDFDIDTETGLQKSRFVLDYLKSADKSKVKEYFDFIKKLSINSLAGTADDATISRISEMMQEARGGKLEDLEKAVLATEKELTSLNQESAAAYRESISDFIYKMSKDLAILGSEIAMALEKEAVKIWKEASTAKIEGEGRWAQAVKITWNRSEAFASRLAQIGKKGDATRDIRGLEWREKELAREAASYNPLSGGVLAQTGVQKDLVGWEKTLYDAETDRLVAVDRLNAAIEIQTDVTREYSETLSQAKGILSSTFSDYKTIYASFFGGSQEIRNIDAQISELRREGTPEAKTRITDLEREKKNIRQQRPKPLVNLLEQFSGYSTKSLFDDATDLFTGIKIGNNKIGDYLAKFMLGPRGEYLKKEGFAAESMYKDAKDRLQQLAGDSYENRMYWIAINQQRIQQGILEGVSEIVKQYTGKSADLVGALAKGMSDESAGGSQLDAAAAAAKDAAAAAASYDQGQYQAYSGPYQAAPQSAVDSGKSAPIPASQAAVPAAYDPNKMAGYMALAGIAGNVGGSYLSQKGMGRTGEYAGLGASIGSGLAMVLAGTNPLLGAGLVLGGSLLGALASPKLDNSSLDRNTQAILNNTAAIEKLSSAVFHAPTTFSMPRSMLGDIGSYDVGFDRVPDRPTILPG